MQALARFSGKPECDRLAAGGGEWLMRRWAKQFTAVGIGHNNAAVSIIWKYFLWKSRRYGKIKMITEVTILRPFIVTAEITDGHFHLRDVDHPLVTDADNIDAAAGF